MILASGQIDLNQTEEGIHDRAIGRDRSHNAKVEPDRGAYRICRLVYSVYEIAVMVADIDRQNSKREGETKLLKECVNHATLLDDNSKQCISDCFAQVEQCKAYRNAIIHHHIYDHEKGIGSYIDDSHSAYQILVSIDALQFYMKYFARCWTSCGKLTCCSASKRTRKTR